jgi:hypothetical protein
MVCFDIGGQYGWHALAFARLSAKVVTFEPDAEVLQDSVGPGAQGRRRGALRGNGCSATRRVGACRFHRVDVDLEELDVVRSAGETLGRVSGLIVETHSLELECDCRRPLMSRACGYGW